jgi:hypothetical protein
MADPEHLRRLAARMLAAAETAEDKTLVQLLTKRAVDHLDEAMALETEPNDPERKNRPFRSP